METYSVCGIRILSMWEVVIQYTRSGFSACGKRIFSMWEEDIQYCGGLGVTSIFAAPPAIDW